MHNLAKRCSAVVRIESVGKSVEGRDLWALELSDLSRSHLARPAFRYVGNMHGDEPSGRQAMQAEPAALCASQPDWSMEASQAADVARIIGCWPDTRGDR